MNKEPTHTEILLAKIAFRCFGKDIYHAFARLLPLQGKETVLDFGSGLGTIAYYAAKRLPQGRLICADISYKWMKTCQQTLKHYTNVAYVHGSIEALANLHEQFDVIYCHFFLHDIPASDLAMLLPGLINLLKPNGLLVFREPLRDRKKLNLIQAILEQHLAKVKNRITAIPFMGNTLESIYQNKEDLPCCK